MRVMIVDDNRDIAESLCVLLTMEGHDARAAFTGESALTLARQFRPHVAIIDLVLPDMNGYELTARLRANPDCAHLRVIACSGHITEATTNRAYAAGMDPFLFKPFDPEVLLLILDRVNALIPPQPSVGTASGNPASDRLPSERR